MLTVVGIMTAGIVLGFMIRKYPAIIRISDTLTTWAIFLLLFLLGLAIGRNDEIMRNLHSLGLQALLITIGGVAGSVLLAFVLYKTLFKKGENEK